MKLNKSVSKVWIIFLFIPCVSWANTKCDQLSIIAEDTMRQRQAGADFFQMFKPAIDGYIGKVKKTTNMNDVRKLTGAFEEIFTIAQLAHKTDIETDGKIQNEAIYSFADKIKTVCLESKH